MAKRLLDRIWNIIFPEYYCTFHEDIDPDAETVHVDPCHADCIHGYHPRSCPFKIKADKT
jgi:hypothetical protein